MPESTPPRGGQDAAAELRPARAGELDEVIALVARTVRATYGGLSPEMDRLLQTSPASVVGDAAYWRGCVVAVVAGRIAGVALTRGDLLEDLWVEPQAQRCGLGSALLSEAERSMARRGLAFARLNVVSANERAIAFYEAHGWTRGVRYPNARWNTEMLSMDKRLPPG